MTTGTGSESKFPQIGREIGELVAIKQAAYGDSFGKSGDVMKALYPKGISVEQLPDALTVVRVVDKLFRIATARDALGESPWRDIAGYSLLSVARVEANKLADPAPAKEWKPLSQCPGCDEKVTNNGRGYEEGRGFICPNCGNNFAW